MSSPLLVTKDQILTDTVMAAAAAVGTRVDVIRTSESVCAQWSAAPIVLVGTDLASRVASMGLPERLGVHLCGTDAAELARWSVLLEATVLLLPDQTGYLSSILGADRPARSSRARVVAVVGGSGGVGASTLAAALARVASESVERVALVETDTHGGGIDLLFGAESEPGWRWDQLSSASGHIDDLASRLPSAAGVDLVSRGRPTDSWSEVPKRALLAVVGSLARSHDVVILDVGAWPQMVDLPVSRSLLVAAADVKSVMAAGSKVRGCGLSGAGLVVRGGPGHRLDRALVADVLGLHLSGVLPHDPRLPGALEDGEPPGMRRGRYRRAVDKLVEREVLP